MTDFSSRRRAVRIGREKLPPALQSMIMVFESGYRVTVETFDASTIGLGVQVPLPEALLRANPGILLEGHEGEFRLIGEIVFVIAVNPMESRAGIAFSQTYAMENYLRLMPSEAETS